MTNYEAILRRLESIKDEAKVIILRVEETEARVPGYVPESVTAQIDAGAKQIQMDVAMLNVHRKDIKKERDNA